MENKTEEQKKSKSKSDILTKIFTLQNIGMALGFIACIIFWLPIYKYQEVHGFWFLKRIEEKTLDLKPGMISGLIAIILNLILYARGIISYKNRWVGLVSFLINLTLLATMIEIFVSPTASQATTNPFLNNVFALVSAAVCLAILIFGVKEIAKFVLVIFFLGLFYMNLKVVNDAMGVIGYINLVIVLVSLILQQSIDFKNMGEEVKYLFGHAKRQSYLTENEVNALIEKKFTEKLSQDKFSEKTDDVERKF
ncbi:MAG: hypothetical protein K6G52_05365 [Treponemataceae bacterium]|nr:hypothetical protein [Treponemataceae bacterium]